MNLSEFKQEFFQECNKEYGARSDALLLVAGRNPIADSRTAGFLEGLTWVLRLAERIEYPEKHRQHTPRDEDFDS